MKTISEFSQAILVNKDAPHALADLLLEMGAKYAYISDHYKDLRLAKSAFWQLNKTGEKRRSDKEIEIEWHATKDGTEELRATLELKSLEKLSSNVKAYLRVLENESRNNH